MYYPPIYGMHIVLVILCLIGGVVITVKERTLLNVTATLLLFVLATVFGIYCWKWRPSEMRSLIERERVIWEHALSIEKKLKARSSYNHRNRKQPLP